MNLSGFGRIRFESRQKIYNTEYSLILKSKKRDTNKRYVNERVLECPCLTDYVNK